MGAGALNSSEQASIRADMYVFAKGLITSGNGYAPPATLSNYNSPALFNQGATQSASPGIQIPRQMGNNYTLSRMLILAGFGLTFNDNTTDDPPLTNTCSATRYQICPDGTAGSLHAYWNYVDGSMLYLENAHLEDPIVGWKEYQAAYHNLLKQPTCHYSEGPPWPCFGDGRGGESSEGSWYGYSLVRLRYLLNLIHTAGYNDPILYGPQISLDTSSWWDLKYVEDAEFLTGFSARNGPQVCPNCVAPAYSYLQTGDSNTYYRSVNDMATEAATLTADSYTGRTDRTSALKWLVMNMAYGGPLGTLKGCASGCGFDAALANPWVGGGVAIDFFISLPPGDPVAALPPDPRPSMPTDLYNGSFIQHVMVRDGWSSPTLFTAYAPNTLVNHELQWAGRFDIFANGEYITKGRTVFTDYNVFMSAASQSNISSIMNTANPTLGAVCSVASGNCGFMTWAAVGGGQFWQGEQAGFVPLLHSELPAYSAFIVDTVNVYNGIPHWTNVPVYDYVTGASRSIVYLRGTNQVVIYDRAATSKGLGKSVSQITTGAPTVTGNTASWLTRSSSQRAYLTNLLPSGAAVVNNGLPCQNCSADQAADWEPFAQLSINAPGTPLSTQFLSVLEWGPSTISKAPTTLVESSSGQNFDCALISSSLVCFMRNWPTAFTGTTYPASGATTQYISDLTPNTTYTIAGTGAPTSATADTAGVLAFPAAGTGSITIRAAAGIGAANKSGTAAVYAVAACAAAILITSCRAKYLAARLKAHRQSNGRRRVALQDSLTARRSVLDT
jgi:hypothetical protein